MIAIAGLRSSQHIHKRAASRFFKAAKHAEGQPRPLNLMVTVNLTHTACSSPEASPAMADIVAKFGRWLRYQSLKASKAGRPRYGAPTYGIVVENPGDITHAHWLVHIPDDLRDLFEKALPNWVSKATGGITKPAGAIDLEPIETVMSLSRYLMKGVDRTHAQRCFVRPVAQGIVFGRRVSISRSLGPAARKRATEARSLH